MDFDHDLFGKLKKQMLQVNTGKCVAVLMGNGWRPHEREYGLCTKLSKLLIYDFRDS